MCPVRFVTYVSGRSAKALESNLPNQVSHFSGFPFVVIHACYTKGMKKMPDTFISCAEIKFIIITAGCLCLSSRHSSERSSYSRLKTPHRKKAIRIREALDAEWGRKFYEAEAALVESSDRRDPIIVRPPVVTEPLAQRRVREYVDEQRPP